MPTGRPAQRLTKPRHACTFRRTLSDFSCVLTHREDESLCPLVDLHSDSPSQDMRARSDQLSPTSHVFSRIGRTKVYAHWPTCTTTHQAKTCVHVPTNFSPTSDVFSRIGRTKVYAHWSTCTTTHQAKTCVHAPTNFSPTSLRMETHIDCEKIGHRVICMSVIGRLLSDFSPPVCNRNIKNQHF